MPNGDYPEPSLWEKVKVVCEYRDRYAKENRQLHEENARLRRERDAAVKRLGEKALGDGGDDA